MQFLKNTFFILAAITLFSCDSLEEIIPASDFQPLDNTTVTPANNVFAGDRLVIKGKNFIKKKEYNQVWFGNIQGTIDSCNETQIFLKVPVNAQSGILSVSNGAYSDTITREFSILKRIIRPYTRLTVSYSGFNSVRTTTTTATGPAYGDYTITRIDTTYYLSSQYSFKGNDTVTRIYFNAALAHAERSFLTDSAFFAVPFLSYARDYSNPASVAMVEMDDDSSNKIFRNLIFTRATITESSNSRNWQTTKMAFTNVPYMSDGKKKIIDLDRDAFQQHLTKLSIDSTDIKTSNAENSHSSKRMDMLYDGILNFHVQSYFKMTLE